jgi:hypothetical protein
LFQTIPKKKCITQVFTDTDVNVGFIKHTLIRLTSSVGIENSMKMLWNTSFITKSYAFLKSLNNQFTVLLYFCFSPVSDECRISDE